jgi:hypothetical protein
VPGGPVIVPDDVLRLGLAATLEAEAKVIEATPVESPERHQLKTRWLSSRPNDNYHVTHARRVAQLLLGGRRRRWRHCGCTSKARWLQVGFPRRLERRIAKDDFVEVGKEGEEVKLGNGSVARVRALTAKVEATGQTHVLVYVDELHSLDDPEDDLVKYFSHLA